MSPEGREPADRSSDETFARRRADGCDRVAAKERALAESARTRAQTARIPQRAAALQRLAEIHDEAARLQAESGAYYRDLADRIAVEHAHP